MLIQPKPKFTECRACGILLEEPNRKRQFCSFRCASSAKKQEYKVNNPMRGNSTGTTGTISELRVSVDLLIRGYAVFRALSQSCPCDLAILHETTLLRVEVATAFRRAHGQVFSPHMKNRDKYDILAQVLPDCIIYTPELPAIS